MEGASKMFRNKEQGTALVEFSLVLPLLLLLIFGIIEFSILFYDKAVITNASREAAREFAIHKDPAALSGLPTKLNNVVKDYAENRMISLTEDSDPVLITKIDGVTRSASTKVVSDEYVTATVNYTYEWMFLPGFMSNALPDINLSASTTMRNEDYEP